jgi:hypothetical protein
MHELMAAKEGAADDIGKLSKGEFYLSTEGSLRPFRVRAPLASAGTFPTRQRLRKSFGRLDLALGSSPRRHQLSVVWANRLKNTFWGAATLKRPERTERSLGRPKCAALQPQRL